MTQKKLEVFVRFIRNSLNSVISVLVCVLLLFCLTAAPETAAAESSSEAAESFLALVDDGDYSQAWWEGSELLHLIEPLDQWVAAQRVGRELFGELKRRSVKSIASRSSMPGFPDGAYAIVTFDVRHENKSKGLEILVLRKDAYEIWRVVSYRLR